MDFFALFTNLQANDRAYSNVAGRILQIINFISRNFPQKFFTYDK